MAGRGNLSKNSSVGDKNLVVWSKRSNRKKNKKQKKQIITKQNKTKILKMAKQYKTKVI